MVANQSHVMSATTLGTAFARSGNIRDWTKCLIGHKMGFNIAIANIRFLDALGTMESNLTTNIIDLLVGMHQMSHRGATGPLRDEFTTGLVVKATLIWANRSQKSICALTIGKNCHLWMVIFNISIFYGTSTAVRPDVCSSIDTPICTAWRVNSRWAWLQ